MTILYLDIFSGISGDMLLGALIDLGVDFHQLEHELGKLGLHDYHLHVSRQKRSSIEGTKFDVHLEADHHHEHQPHGAHSHHHEPHEHHHETHAHGRHDHGHAHEPAHHGEAEHAHGRFPIPAPATLEILTARAIPIAQCDEPHELVTPTGAALLAECVESFGPMQDFAPAKIGYGLGARENKTRPNVLRAVLGDAQA